MTAPILDPDRDARRVWTMLATVGAILCVIGWYVWASGGQL
jgi:hypothetical protein